jgi:hypothetical protein
MVARRQIVLSLVDALEPIVSGISELTTQIRQAFDDQRSSPPEHPGHEGRLDTSFPR